MTTLERNIARVRACAAQRLWRQMLMGITADQRDWLEALLVPPGSARQSLLDRLRDGPVLQSPAELARALEEGGRMVKSPYLLPYIDGESYRRRMLVQLNRGEGRHQLARAVFHGQRGGLRQRHREGQLGALGLVVNVIVLWNTLYMDAALAQLRAEGFDVRDGDVARLSPLRFEHINMLGRYASSCPMPSHGANSGLFAILQQAATTLTRQPLHRFYVPLPPGSDTDSPLG